MTARTYAAFVPYLNKLGTAVRRGRGDAAAARSSLLRIRASLTVFFALDGFIFAGWVVRIPAIKERTDASASTLGLALLGVSAGAVVTMMVTGRLCRRFGSRPVTIVCAVLVSLSVALPPHTHSALALGLVLVVFGAGYGGLNVAMNSMAVDVVAALRRPVISSFHAAYSLGGMAGAGLGGLIAGSLSPGVHLLLLTCLGLLVTAVVGPVLIRQPAPGTDLPAHVTADVSAARTAAPAADGARATGQAAREAADTAPAPPGGRTRGLVVLFGVIALCTAYGEGAMADWSALHLSEDLGATPGLAAAGYTLFALTMMIGRLSGTALQERLGQAPTLVAGGVVAALGMLLGALAPTVPLALLGFAVAGLGLANIFPVALGRAGALAGPGGVAAASTLGYGGMLLGPPAIGFLADWLTLPTALTTVALLSAAAAVIGYAARNVSTRPAGPHA